MEDNNRRRAVRGADNRAHVDAGLRPRASRGYTYTDSDGSTVHVTYLTPCGRAYCANTLCRDCNPAAYCNCDPYDETPCPLCDA